MKRKIGIIGSGAAGLQLGYALKDEFDVVLHYFEEAEAVRHGRIQSTQVHFRPTLKREERFKMPEASGAPPIRTIHFSMGPQKLFVGQLAGTASSVDQRTAFAAALDDLKAKGVRLRKGRIDREGLERLAADYDLIVDAIGKAGPVAPFPVLSDLTPQADKPLRKCIVGYFKGVAPVEPAGISITVLPGAGEMFEIPALTEHGPASILFIEAVPDGPLDAFKGVKTADEFSDRMKTVLQEQFAELAGRLDAGRFALIDDRAFLLTAVTPRIRQPYMTVNGTLALGCGDSVFLMDPITGQGCNTASYCAEQLYETLVAHRESPWDDKVGFDYWARTRPYVTAVSAWTDAMARPLPEHIGQLLMQAASDQSAADRIAHWFEEPPKAYDTFFG